MAKCLVTGGAGFIGSNLADALVDGGHEVVIIDDLSTGKESYLNPKAKFYRVDICSGEIEKIFEIEKFDFVFHLAAQIDVRISVEDPILDNKINVLGGYNILRNSRKNNVKKLIFSSTGGAVYGDASEVPTTENYLPAPVSPYGIHKLAFEKYLNYFHKVYGQEYIALRFANVYGPRQFKGGEAGVIAIFTDNAVNGKKSIINGQGMQTRDYVYVGDAVKAFLAAMDADHNGEINIATGREINLLEMIRMIEAALGREIEKEHGSAKEGEQMRSCLSNLKAKEVLGWQPEVVLEDGIRRTIEWAKSRNA